MKSERILVVEVETGAVRAALVTLRADGNAAVHEKTTQRFRLWPAVEEQHLFAQVREGLALATDRLLRSHGGSVDRAECVLGAPWYDVTLRTVHVRHNFPFVVKKDFLYQLRQEEREAAFGKKRAADNSMPHPLEEMLISSAVNGYPVAFPEGKRGTTLDAAFYFSTIYAALQPFLAEALSRHVHHSRIAVRSFPLEAFRALSGVVDTHEGFLFVRISGEATELFSVQQNALTNVVYFAQGERTVVRAVASALRISLEAAAEALERASSGEKGNAALESAVDAASRDWFGVFRGVVRDMGEERLLPHRVYITGGGALGERAAAFAGGEHLASHTILGRPFAVTPFSARAVSGFVQLEEALVAEEETALFLALLAARRRIAVPSMNFV